MRKNNPKIPRIIIGPNHKDVNPKIIQKDASAPNKNIGKSKTPVAKSPASCPANSRESKVPFFICLTILIALKIPIIKKLPQ